MALDLTALTASLGAYCKQHGSELYSKLLAKEYSNKYFRTIAGVKDQFVMTEVEVKDVMQAYQKAWTPSTDAAVRAEILQVYRQKIDWEFDPVALEKTFIGDMIDGSSIEGQQLFEGFLVDQIFLAFRKQFEYKELFKGVFVTPTPGTANPAGANMNGLLKLVVDGIAASKITPTVTGVITQATSRDAFESVFDGVATDFQSEETIALCSPLMYRWYKRDYRAEFGGNQDYRNMAGELEPTMIDGTNCQISPCPGMAGSQRIVVTPKSNLVRIIDGTGEDETLNLEFVRNRRVIEVQGDFKLGVGFPIIKDMVWTNDQA